MLGIPVDASAKDLAANKGKMRLLDIGKEVVFPLDLPSLLPLANRSKVSVAAAERDINLPQDKIKYALFWFAQPSDPLGKLAYDHLLQGNTTKAEELFGKRSSWESQLCLAVLELQRGQLCDALLDFYSIANRYCDELCHTVTKQNYSMSSAELIRLYLSMLTTEIDALTLLQEWNKDNRVLPKGSEIIESELLKMATDVPIKSLEKAIATAKAVDKDNAQAQLEAGKQLSNNTHKVRIQLQELIGKYDPRYGRLVDKLANQILQCSINYFNNIEGENRAIIENALKLGEYALNIAVGKMARDHIQHNVDILRKKKEDLPPAEVEEQDSAIKRIIVENVLIKGQTIDCAIQLMKDAAPHIIAVKEKQAIDATLRPYYLNISTQVVNAALTCVIEEHNNETERINSSSSTDNEKLASVRKMLELAWKAILMMDVFDTEENFRNSRYSPNRDAIKDIINKLGGTFRSPSDNPLMDVLDSPSIHILLSSFSPYSTPYIKSWRLDYRVDFQEFDLRTEEEQFRDCGKASDYKAYYDKFSNGKHKQEAWEKYEECLAEECRCINDCNKYLEEFPYGKYVEKVRDKKEEQEFIGCGKSIEEYRKYLSKYPSGRFRQDAMQRITEIETYNNCRTIEDYRGYISHYQTGLFKKEANDKLDDMVYASCTNKKLLQNYLQEYPNGRHKREAESRLNEGCYIATMVYGSYEHSQVMVLRRFRDDVLQQNQFGRAFVRFYYRYSPTWVEHLKDKKWINNFIRTILDTFIKIYRK